MPETNVGGTVLLVFNSRCAFFVFLHSGDRGRGSTSRPFHPHGVAKPPLLDRVFQSLAGRTRILHIYPFSLSELEERDPWDPEFQLVPDASRASGMGRDLHTALHTGFFPRIHDRRLDPVPWLGDYRTTYVERELRKIGNVQDLDAFERFLGLCAGRSGQLFNASSLGNDAGIDHTTVRRWPTTWNSFPASEW